MPSCRILSHVPKAMNIRTGMTKKPFERAWGAGGAVEVPLAADESQTMAEAADILFSQDPLVAPEGFALIQRGCASS